MLGRGIGFSRWVAFAAGGLLTAATGWTGVAWANPTQLPVTYNVNAVAGVSATYQVGIYADTSCAITADIGDGTSIPVTFSANGDGTYTGSVNHAFAAAGIYLINAETSNAACASLVQDIANVVSVATPVTVSVGQPVTLTFGIYTDTTCTVTANFGDGGTGPTTYVLNANGTYNAVATRAYAAIGSYYAYTPDGENCASADTGTSQTEILFPDTSQVTVIAAGTGGAPSPSGTPELDSLALFGAGLLGLGGYASARWRERRRRYPPHG